MLLLYQSDFSEQESNSAHSSGQQTSFDDTLCLPWTEQETSAESFKASSVANLINILCS